MDWILANFLSSTIVQCMTCYNNEFKPNTMDDSQTRHMDNKSYPNMTDINEHFLHFHAKNRGIA